MKRWVKFIGFAFSCFCIASSGHSQQGTQFIVPLPSLPVTYGFAGSGARAMGMGNAYIGVSDDITAVSWNPAGLYVQQIPMFGISFGSFRPRGEFVNLKTTANQTASLNSISMLTFLAPVRIKGHHVVFSGNFYRSFDEYRNEGNLLEIQFDANPFDGLNETSLYSAKYSAEYETGVDVFSVGFGTRIYNQLALGIATNVYLGKSINSQVTRYSLDDFEPLDKPGQLADVAANESVLDTTRYSGMNLTQSRFSVGLTVRTPFALGLSRDLRFDFTSFTNGLPDRANPLPILSDNNVTKISMPLFLAAGIGYKINYRWLVAGDVEYRNFTSTEIKNRTSFIVSSGADTEVYSTLVPGNDPTLAHLKYRSAPSFRLGTEYLWNMKDSLSSSLVIPLRAGIRFESLPTADVTYIVDTTGFITGVNATTPKSTTFSLGTGVRFSQIHLDFSYSHTSYERDYVLPLAIITSPDPQAVRLVIVENPTSKVSDNRFNITFTGYF